LIALDTNILIYARREELPQHRKARAVLRRLAEGDAPWAIPWPCIYEFLRVVTHPRVFDPPTPLDRALEDLESLFDSPSLVLLGEGPGHAGHMRLAVTGSRARGNAVHDAHIVALCIEHDVREILTADRDLARFPGIVARNPLE
jgi:uncharacterized protein